MKRYLLLLLIPMLGFASIGKITVLKGKVTITRDGQTTRAKAGGTLEKNDYIKTAKNAKMQIIFNDKTIFTIGKSSTLDIADYLYDESKPSNNKASFNVLKGAFTSITGRIGKLNKSKFKLKTKSASIGIRGTIVKANQETVMCTQGAITVTAGGISMDVEAGSKTSVASGAPSKPEAITAEDEAALGADVTEEDKQESDKQAASENKEDKKKESTKDNDTKVDNSADKEQKKKTEEALQNEINAKSGLKSRTTRPFGSSTDKEAKIRNEIAVDGSRLVATCPFFLASSSRLSLASSVCWDLS